MNNVTNLAENFSYEDLAHALYLKGEGEGYHKVTDKTKWREPVMATKLGHEGFEKISAGAGSDKYGADAYDPNKDIMAEYKSKAVNDKEVRNLVGRVKNKNGDTFAPLKVSGVYNGAYTLEAIEKYSHHDHYIGVFWKEKCVLIIKPHTNYVIETLTTNHNNRVAGATTNLNTVVVNLGDTEKYEVAYKDTDWFESMK